MEIEWVVFFVFLPIFLWLEHQKKDNFSLGFVGSLIAILVGVFGGFSNRK